MISDKTQKQLFVNGEADAWYQRNSASGGICLDVRLEKDPILRALDFLDLPFKKTLEIGCSNGWRLEAIRQIYKCEVVGIEPSTEAIDDGRKKYPHIEFHKGTADILPFDDASMQGVILGFCLYLCDRAELFKIVAEVDRILETNGWVVILDFGPPDSYKNTYMHAKGIYSYKMDHAELFKANPIYIEQFRQILPHSGHTDMEPDNRVMVSVLRKFPQYAFPTEA